MGPFSAANRLWFNANLRPHPYDPPGALRRLAAEGFHLEGEWLVDPDGHPVDFSVITNAGNRARERMAALIQQDLRRLGIQLNIVTLDFPSLIERISRTFQYEACLLESLSRSTASRQVAICERHRVKSECGVIWRVSPWKRRVPGLSISTNTSRHVTELFVR